MASFNRRRSGNALRPHSEVARGREGAGRREGGGGGGWRATPSTTPCSGSRRVWQGGWRI
eukprot:11187089-Lingulodinium_polyedra.AAC.1